MKSADALSGAELLGLIPEGWRDEPHRDLHGMTPREAAEEFDWCEAERPKQPTCPMCLLTLKVLAGVIPGAA